jgi:hypothetical protein
MADDPSWLDIERRFLAIGDNPTDPLCAEYDPLRWPDRLASSSIVPDAQEWRLTGGNYSTERYFIAIAGLAVKKLGQSRDEWWRWLDLLRKNDETMNSSDRGNHLRLYEGEIAISLIAASAREAQRLDGLTRSVADIDKMLKRMGCGGLPAKAAAANFSERATWLARFKGRLRNAKPVDRKTLQRALRGQPIQEASVKAIANALNVDRSEIPDN